MHGVLRGAALLNFTLPMFGITNVRIDEITEGMVEAEEALPAAE